MFMSCNKRINIFFQLAAIGLLLCLSWLPVDHALAEPPTPPEPPARGAARCIGTTGTVALCSSLPPVAGHLTPLQEEPAVSLLHLPNQDESQVTLFTAVADAFIVSGYRNMNLGDFKGMWVGYTQQEHIGVERGVVRFDISIIPHWATVHSASLLMVMAQTNNPTPMSIAAHRITHDWSELSANWSNLAGEYAEAYDTISVGEEVAWYAWDVTELVQAWVNGEYPNFGIMLRGAESGPNNEKGFVTREVDPQFAPQLLVEYTPDTTPPQTHLYALPEYSAADAVTLRWNVTEQGSGVERYEIQYRDQAADQWRGPLRVEDPKSRMTTFTFGSPGRTYEFRMRAIDRAGNAEPWPEEPESSTTLYHRYARGTVYDNRGVGVGRATIDADPAALNQPQTDTAGRYEVYWAALGPSFTLRASKSKYGAASRNLLLPDIAQPIDLILPPLDNQINNGDFHTDDLTGWTVQGTATDTVGVILDPQGQERGAQINSLTPEIFGQTGEYWGNPTFAIDMNHTVHVAWVAVTGQGGPLAPRHLYYAYRTSDGTWSEPYLISTEDRPSDPALAVDSQNGVHLTWTAVDRPTGQWLIRYAYRSPAGVWSTPVQAPNPPESDRYSNIAVTEDDTLYLVWINNDEWVTIAYRELPDGKWSEPLFLPGGSLVTGTDIGTWRNSVHLLWIHPFAAQSWGVYYTSGQKGDWGTPIRLYGELGQWAVQSDLTVAPDGTAHALWEVEGQLYHRQRPPGGGWSAAEVFPAIENRMFRAIATLDGVIHIIWQGLSPTPFDLLLYTPLFPDGRLSEPVSFMLANIAPDTSFIDLVPKVDENGELHLAIRGGSERGSSEWLAYLGPSLADGDTILAQTVTIPTTVSAPTLSWRYRWAQLGTLPNARFDVQVNGTTVWSAAEQQSKWTHRWIDVSPWKGETVEIRFVVHHTAGGNRAWLRLDDISLGTAYADVYTHLQGPVSTLPGNRVRYWLIAGNLGGAPAASVEVTATLPTTLADVASDPLPDLQEDGTLTWHIGTLKGHTSQAIEIQGRLASELPLSTTLTLQAIATTPSLEANVENNTATINTMTVARAFLPLIGRNAFP